MYRRKTNITDVLFVLFAWLIALSLVYLVYIKIKLLHH
jgi:hypothetical protein